MESIALHYGDSQSTSFVLLHSTENDSLRFVVEKQMAQLLFRRRGLPDDLLDVTQDGALEINRDEHGIVFEVLVIMFFY